MTRIAGLLLLLVAGLLLYEAVVLGSHLWQARALAAESSAFERFLPNPLHRVLVVGDSTAVGTGARAPADSVAGRLAADFPHVEVVNRAQDGARMADVLEQLSAAPEEPFDVVLIQAGGNDILRFTDLETLRMLATRVLQAASARGGEVAMMSTGDVGTAPAFMPPLSWLLSQRTRKVRGLLIDVSATAAIHYVDLYRPPEQDPFLREPQRYYAADGLHPSSEGFRLWYERLLDEVPMARWLGAGGSVGKATP